MPRLGLPDQRHAGLLAFRIWQVKRQSRQYLGTNALSPLLRVVIESGAIYSMTVTAALITFVTKSNGVYVVLDIVRAPTAPARTALTDPARSSRPSSRSCST